MNVLRTFYEQEQLQYHEKRIRLVQVLFYKEVSLVRSLNNIFSMVRPFGVVLARIHYT